MSDQRSAFSVQRSGFCVLSMGRNHVLRRHSLPAGALSSWLAYPHRSRMEYSLCQLDQQRLCRSTVKIYGLLRFQRIFEWDNFLQQRVVLQRFRNLLLVFNITWNIQSMESWNEWVQLFSFDFFNNRVPQNSKNVTIESRVYSENSFLPQRAQSMRKGRKRKWLPAFLILLNILIMNTLRP